MKKTILIIFIALISLVVLSRCIFVNKFVYTDKELTEHYRDQPLKPQYKDVLFLGRNVHYAVISKNDTLPLLVMVHGAPGAWYGYLNLTDDKALQDHFRIVSVDRLGYGKSGYGKEELSVQVQALAIKNIIERENRSGKKVYLLGRSYGAPITAWLAINYPQNFEKLVMVSPVIDPDKEKFYWFSEIGRLPAVQWILPDLLNVATREKFAHQQEMKNMLPKWDHLYTPTSVLVGENDDVADTANYSFARKHIINCTATFLKLRNTGHQITRQQPEFVKCMLLGSSYENMASVISEEAHQGNMYAMKASPSPGAVFPAASRVNSESVMNNNRSAPAPQSINLNLR
jgi:pimeloyl-ACP methyl ester carboxylesterase